MQEELSRNDTQPFQVASMFRRPKGPTESSLFYCGTYVVGRWGDELAGRATQIAAVTRVQRAQFCGLTLGRDREHQRTTRCTPVYAYLSLDIQYTTLQPDTPFLHHGQPLVVLVSPLVTVEAVAEVSVVSLGYLTL